MPKILVVDDELSIRESFKLILEGRYELLLAASGEAALKIIADQPVDLAFLDIRMPGLNGLETLRQIKELNPAVEIVMVTAVNDVSKANEAIRHGARDYVVKPFDVNGILKLTEQLLRRKAILAEGSRLKQAAQVGIELFSLQGALDQVKGAKRVLLIGETGTEKAGFARLLDPNCQVLSLSSDLPLSRIKTLLFGRDQGASTADLQSETGILERGKNGTIFIDNLELLPAELLTKLKSASFTREGGETKIDFTGRLIGGARKKIDSFADLEIALPPLRERPADIPLLLNFFLEQFNSLYGREVKIELAAIEALSGYSWPGNIEELKQVVTRLVLGARGQTAGLNDLPLAILAKEGRPAEGDYLAEFEKSYIGRIMEATANQPDAAAAILGIAPQVLAAKQ